MQSYRGQYLQVFTETRDYGGDLFTLGQETASGILGEIRNSPRPRDPFLPRLAVVFFTQPNSNTDDTAGGPPEPLSQLCAGINAGLGNVGDRVEEVPLIGCSVASIPDVEKQELHRHGFSLTLLVARQRDLAVRVGGSSGFVDEEEGHKKAWDDCLHTIEEQDFAARATESRLPDDSFILAFFPGLVKGAMDFKARNLASYRYLRGKMSSDLPIYGVGAGEFDVVQRKCQVMAGSVLIPSGYALAKVRTTLRFKMSMDHNLSMADEVLLVKELRDGSPGKFILSFAVPPDYSTVPAPQVYMSLKEKYNTERFAFRVVEFSDARENLLFLSIVDVKEDSLKLVGPIKEDTLIRPAFANLSKPLFSPEVAASLAEDGPVAVVFSMSCHGMFRLLGSKEPECEAAVLRQLQKASQEPQAPGYSFVSGFVFGEWGLGQDVNGQAQYYHSTTLALADALTPRYHQRRQLEVIDRCSRDMFAGLLRAEEQTSERRLTARQAAAVLANSIFEAIVDLGYDGGLISLVNEIDQTIVGAEAHGAIWETLKDLTVVRLDEPDILAQVYRDSLRLQTESHVADSRQESTCHREAGAGIVSQTVLPLWDGSRCLGTLQVGHSAQRTHLPDHERNALSAIAGTAALHLGGIRAQETIRDLEEAVRYAVSCDDQEKGWCHLAQVAARAVEVPFCAIRVRDSTGSFLKLGGASQELLELTRRLGRGFTSITEGQGPVVKLFRHYESQSRHTEQSTEVHVVNDASNDPDLKMIAGNSAELAKFYQSVRSYALDALVSPQQGLVGIISFLSFRPNFFTPERTELVRKIAGYASIVAKVYKSVTREQSMLETTLSLTTIQAEVDRILRSAEDFKAAFKAAATLLVTETVKILPCEACTLHRFEEGHLLRLQAAAPDESIHNKTEWDALKPEDHGFLLHLATQRGIYRASGERLRSHPRIRTKTGVWSWLPKTNKLHSILGIPLVDPDGRHYGILTLYNRLNEEGHPDDAVDFLDVPTRVRSFLQEIATHVLESLESRSRFAHLAELAEEFQVSVDSYFNSTPLISSETVFCQLASSLAKWLDAQVCSIFLVKHPEKHLILRGCSGWEAGSKMIGKAYYDIGEGLTGRLALHKEPIVISNIFTDSRRTGKYFAAMYGPPDPNRTYEMIALPLPVQEGEEPLGIITLHRKLPGEYAYLLRFSEREGFALKLASHPAKLAVTAIEGKSQDEDALEHERPAIAEIFNVAGKERLRSLNYGQLAERIAALFKSRFCGIFLRSGQDPNVITLSGANGELERYVDKIHIQGGEGPVGAAYSTGFTHFRDLPDECTFIGSLDQILRDCLGEPLQNLVAAPMCLGEECGGVILLANRASISQSKRTAKGLWKYQLEALGTGILLVRRNIEFSAHLRTYQDAIAEQRKAAELSSAAQTLGHEARNRLNTISSCLSVLRNPNVSQEKKEERLHWIESTYQSFADIVEQLLEPMRRAGTSEPVNIVDVVDKAVELNLPTAEERGVRLLNCVTSETIVKGRRVQLVGVVSSLLENAIEACERLVGEVRITLDHSLEDDMIVLSVTDNGSGITQEDLRSIFRPGVSTKDPINGKSRGYGLHIAKIMLFFHGGDIKVENSAEGGARVTLWLQGEV